MRKLIAGINMTLDGFCDHTAITTADEALHQHYTEALNNAGTLLYGRITYQLMENYWPTIVKTPSGNQAMDDFAVAIDRVPKIVFSHTLRNVAWDSAKLATRDLEEEVSDLKQQSGKDILVGSPSLIVALTRLGLIDEYQLCIHPIILGSGLTLFKNISDKIMLKRLNTKSFSSGAIILYYEPSGK